jgi:hypothetical protein
MFESFKQFKEFKYQRRSQAQSLSTRNISMLDIMGDQSPNKVLPYQYERYNNNIQAFPLTLKLQQD